MFKQVKDKQKMGIDGYAPPEKYSEKDLSATHDALVELQAIIGLNVQDVWNYLPHDLKMDYVWSSWTYHAREKK